jgi:hypothetical protein
MFNLEEELKKRIPEFQQGDKQLEEFLEAAGAYLDHIKDKIIRISYDHDYENSSRAQLEYIYGEEAFKSPIEFTEDLKRLIVRDIATVYSIKGTERTIEWLFNAIGLEVDIKHAWILNPDTFTPPPIIDNTTFIYGRERVYNDGTYFVGEDVFGNSYDKLRVIGETYPKTLNTDIDEVGKTPYLFVNITDVDYNKFSQDIDVPVDVGVDDIIIEAFDEVRPANVAIIIVIVSPDYLDPITQSALDSYDDTDLTYPVINDGHWQLGRTINHFRFGEYFQSPDLLSKGLKCEVKRGKNSWQNVH